MRAIVFPGQGAQFEGMGKELCDANPETKKHFEFANDVLGFDLMNIMFNGTSEELRQTKVTQPAIFLYSLAKFFSTTNVENGDFVAGHSLGEFSALVANGCISFKDGLLLVKERALAMQDACDMVDGTMAAILGLENQLIEEVCGSIEEVVVPANYNCPGQLVISGSQAGIDKAIEVLKEKGARRALKLPVGGAFHSPLMLPAQERLASAIEKIEINVPKVPIVQNVTAKATSDPEEIRKNIILQLSSPVKWEQSMSEFVNLGITKHVECGAKVLTGFIRKFDRAIETEIL